MSNHHNQDEKVIASADDATTVLSSPSHRELFSKKFERETIAKVDRRLLVILGALYAICLIDRHNIAIARIVGMGKALHIIVGQRYSLLTSVYSIPYILFELPMMIIMRKIGVRLHLTIVVVAWGMITMIIGAVNDWRQLLALRVMLGFFESAFFPCCIYLISSWYTRYETQQRIAWFFATSLVISGFSNIIGYGFSRLDGTHNIAGWRWVFIVYGAATIGLGAIGALLIVDFPDRNRFLTADQTHLIQERIDRDRADCAPDEITLAKVGKHLRDPNLWVFGLCFFFSTTVAYAFTYFLPVILAGGGYSTVLALCLSAPPYVWSAIYTVGIAYCADRARRRAIFIILNALICLTGLIIMAWGHRVGIRYIGAFFTLGGAQCNIPSILTYGQNNVRLQSKRAVASAVIIGMGGLGGIASSFIYRQKDSPRYIPGLAATMGCQIAIILILIAQTLAFKRANAKADRDGTEIEGSISFRYTL